jgi:hypothetical protein
MGHTLSFFFFFWFFASSFPLLRLAWAGLDTVSSFFFCPLSRCVGFFSPFFSLFGAHIPCRYDDDGFYDTGRTWERAEFHRLAAVGDGESESQIQNPFVDEGRRNAIGMISILKLYGLMGQRLLRPFEMTTFNFQRFSASGLEARASIL